MALSGRSRCNACKNGKNVRRKSNNDISTSRHIISSSDNISFQSAHQIAKDDVRVGSFDKIGGTYTKWHHLDCWKVPKVLRDGLTDTLDEEITLLDLLSMVGEDISCAFFNSVFISCFKYFTHIVVR